MNYLWIYAFLVSISMLLVESYQCPTQGYPTGKTTIVQAPPFDKSGKKRTYHVLVPKNYKNTIPVPLHLAYAGLNAPCLDIFRQWKNIAELRGFILVAPCSSKSDDPVSIVGGMAWNSGQCCGYKKDSPTDDFAFTRLIINDITSKLCIDENHIVASGFSNGAMMVEVLACKQNDIFRAVASVSGVVELRPGMQGGLDACDAAVMNSTKRTAVLNVHGDLDIMVPWQSDPIMGFPAIPLDMEDWAKRSGCQGEGRQTFSKGNYNNTLWDTCTSGAQIELVHHHTGTHQWPIDKDFNTTAYILSFFDRFK